MTIRAPKNSKREYADVVCDVPGCHPRAQSLPDDEQERSQFLRQIGWRCDADGKHACPFCAGGEHLEKLKVAFEGRGGESLS